MESLFQLESKEPALRDDGDYVKVVNKQQHNSKLLQLTILFQMITVPYDHINENKGKKVRKTLVQIYNHWLKVDEDQADRIADIIQWAHTVSLL